MAGLWQDIRYGLRRLRSAPGFTCAVIAILAIGIGGTSGMFSVVDALVLRPLPYKDADRLVWISVALSVGEWVPGPHFLEWEKDARLLSSVGAYSDGSPTLTGVGEPERLQSDSVSSGFFSTLNANMLIGRTFTRSDDVFGAPRVAILSAPLWKRKFNADPNIIGRTIVLDGQTVDIVGVLQQDFRFIEASDIWLPLALPEQGGSNGIAGVSVIGRLAPGVTSAQAESELTALAEPLRSRFGFLTDGDVHIMPLRKKLVGASTRLSMMFLAATAMVLLISCVNAANLLLSRASSRRKAFAIRMALGAGRLRVIREGLMESLLLSLGAGAAGTILTFGITQAIARLAPANLFGWISRIETIEVNPPVLVFTLLLSVLTGLLFGGIPNVQLTGGNVEKVLRNTSRGHTSRTRPQHFLMAFEIAVSVVLLVGAGLLLRGFIHVLQVPAGYNPARLLTLTVDLPDVAYPDPLRRVEFFQTLLGRIAPMPGVQSEATVTYLPLTKLGLRVWPHIDGRPIASTPQGPPTPVASVSSGYFRTMGIPLMQGRAFEEQDDSAAAPVVILSESVAKVLFGAESPLGKKVWVPGKFESPTVVGIVADVHGAGPEQPITPQIYLPAAQNRYPMNTSTIVIRTTGDPQRLIRTMRDEVHALDKDLPIYDVQTMDQRMNSSLAARRFNLLLFGCFAVGAGLLAIAGVYSVIAHITAQRTHEIGIRIALGASKGDIVGLLMREGLAWVTAGLTIGILISLMVTRIMSSLLFEVSPTDWLTFGTVTISMIVVATGACYVPARSSTRMDPTIALRQE